MSRLEEERFEKFKGAAVVVNRHLSFIFSKLSGDQGDAYFSYMGDAALLCEGVTFHVRCGMLLCLVSVPQPLPAKQHITES